jgi:hypothetical protein
MRQVCLVFILVGWIAVPGCADEVPPARSADSPLNTAAAEPPLPALPSLSARASAPSPSAAGSAAGHVHHHAGDAAGGAPK